LYTENTEVSIVVIGDIQHLRGCVETKVSTQPLSTARG